MHSFGIKVRFSEPEFSSLLVLVDLAFLVRIVWLSYIIPTHRIFLSFTPTCLFYNITPTSSLFLFSLQETSRRCLPKAIHSSWRPGVLTRLPSSTHLSLLMSRGSRASFCVWKWQVDIAGPPCVSLQGKSFIHTYIHTYTITTATSCCDLPFVHYVVVVSSECGVSSVVGISSRQKNTNIWKETDMEKKNLKVSLFIFFPKDPSSSFGSR